MRIGAWLSCAAFDVAGGGERHSETRRYHVVDAIGVAARGVCLTPTRAGPASMLDISLVRNEGLRRQLWLGEARALSPMPAL